MNELQVQSAPNITQRKSLYDIGELPPLGFVPDTMHAWVIRRERHGEPEQAMQEEVVSIPSLGPEDVLVLLMAVGINYNGIWASLGEPLSVMDVHKAPYHIGGSDAAGIVWAVGSSVKRWHVGDEVVVHSNRDDGDDEECNGGDPMLSPSQRAWGYETEQGSFAQFTVVQERQLLKRPQHLSWEESACYLATLSTAYRMLFGHPPHTLKPGMNVLIWGASGGVGSMATQLVAVTGAVSVGIISDDAKSDYVKRLGAKGTVNRKDYSCWNPVKASTASAEYDAYVKEVRRFGKEVRAVLGGADPEIVIEHPGESTFPVSCLVTKRGGMVVICAGTTGYNLSLDARFLWMRQKRVQGSHIATLMQAYQANALVHSRQIDPCLSETFQWRDLAKAHTKMHQNKHLPGNMAVLVQAAHVGLGRKSA